MNRIPYYIRLSPPYLLLFIITLIAAFLRFHKLGEWSFWGDEIFTLGSKLDGFIPSLSTRLIHATTSYLVVDEWNARLIPTLIGVVTIPVLFFFVAQIFGKSVGLISSALLAVSTWHIYWSQNARFYALLLLFYSLALLSFYLALDKDKPWYMLLSLIFWGLAVQERLLAIFFIPVVVIYLLALFILPFDKPPGLNIRNLAIYAVAGLVSLLFFTNPFLSNLSGWMTDFGRINNNPLWLFSGFAYYVGIPVICMAGFGAIAMLIQKERAGLFFGLAAMIPVLSIMAASTFQYAANRYFFISLTSWIILASLAINELLKMQKGKSQLLAVGVLVLILGSSLSDDYLYFQYNNGNRENWRAAFEFIKQEEKAHDLIFLSDPDLGDYYLARQTLHFDEFDESVIEITDRRAWFIIDMNTEEVFSQQLSWIEEHAQQVENFDITVLARVFKIRIYLYDPSRGKT